MIENNFSKINQNSHKDENIDIKENKFIWAYSTQEIFKKYGTHPHFGLSDDQASINLERYGFNELKLEKPSFIATYLAPLFNWLIILYLISAGIMLIASLLLHTDNMSLVYVTLTVVVLNCFVAIYQQARATKKLEALQSMAAPKSWVIRDGQIVEIFSKNIVVGDLVKLTTGDQVPADARIISSTDLRVNEASLTGESEPVSKNHGEPLDNKMLHLQNQENILFYGTFITTGHCKAIIFATGTNTEIGKISKGMSEIKSTDIPIRKKMDNLGKWFGISIFILWICTLIFLKITTGKLEFVESLNAAMGIMPVNIPLLVTVIMLTGVVAMAEHGVIVRNVASVDSLGRISVICTDKTGTLTKSQMAVQYIWARGSTFKVTGSGYTPKGDFFLMDIPHKPQMIENIEEFPHLEFLIKSAYLNNNSMLMKYQFEVEKRHKKEIIEDWKVIGSATEGALQTLAKKAGITQKDGVDIRKHYLEIIEFPFSSDVKRMTKVLQNKQTGEIISYTKGASEYLVTNCDYLLGDNGQIFEFSIDLRLIIMNIINEYAMKGYRLLSFAYKPLEFIPEDLESKRDEIENELIYIGFVAIIDPPREGVQNAIDLCHDAGIDVVMITGDSLPTAKAISKNIHILKNPNDLVMDGSKLEELDATVPLEHVKVFSRVIPKNKQSIVEKYQNKGKIVAMTGDGVNDALALNLADVGIAMGIQGTDVAKQAADMVISDDSFISIVEGIRRGRGIFANIRSVVFYFICINIFEGLVNLILSVLLGLPYWFDPEFLQLFLLISGSLHSFTGLILTFDKIPDDVMKEKPRNSQEIISRQFLILLASYGIFLMMVMFGLYFLVSSDIYPIFTVNISHGALDSQYIFTQATQSLWEGTDLKIAKTLTMLATTIFIAEFFMAIQIRRPNKSLWRTLKEDMNLVIILLAIGLFGLLFSLIYIPGWQIFFYSMGFKFQLMFLHIWDLLLCFGFAFFGCILPFEVVRWISRKLGIIF
ncbi:cation-translocating P-type ATPase [Candidatus Harpocratesius sp.]